MTQPKSFWPWRRDPPITGARAYSLAVGSAVAALLGTQFWWPFIDKAPFVLLFASVFITSRWATERAGFLAAAIAALGAYVVIPDSGVPALRLMGIGLFVLVSLITVHLAGQHHRFVQAIQDSESQFRATWEHAALGAAVLDVKGRVERVNPALSGMLGYPASDWTWISFDTFTHPDDAAEERQLFASLISGAQPHYQREQRFKRADGMWVWCRVTASAVRGDDGAVTGALMAIEDVTARRQAESDLRASEAKLRRAQKMEAVGQLVAGVAHNFNNILTITMGYTDLLLEGHKPGDPDRMELEEIRKATARGAVLTRQLLAFSRKKDTQPTKVDLNRAVDDLRDLLNRVIREDISLTMHLAQKPVLIWVDPHDLEQTILNLVFNARDALPAGGRIEIEVSTPTLDQESIPPDVTLPPGECARLRVRDNGAGMTADVQGHLFEPFFTTKEVGHGTGLGLAFVYGVVRHHQGFIAVDTAPGKGTTFDLYFPITTAASASEAVPTPAASSAHVRLGTMVLLVEDEEPVRIVATKMLTRAGYRVLTAATPGEACALFDQHTDEIGLLLTDVVMPGMRGPALAQKLGEKRADLPVLFMSGYSDTMEDVRSAAGQTAFIGKPFTSETLLTAVEELLGAGVR